MARRKSSTPIMNWDSIPNDLFYQTDGGRFISKFPYEKNDCTVISLGVVLNIDYDSAHKILADLGRDLFEPFSVQVHLSEFAKSGTVLNNHIITNIPFPPKKGKERMYVAAFCALYKTGKYILNCPKHVLAVKDGIAYDTEWVPDDIVMNAYRFDKITVVGS